MQPHSSQEIERIKASGSKHHQIKACRSKLAQHAAEAALRKTNTQPRSSMEIKLLNTYINIIYPHSSQKIKGSKDVVKNIAGFKSGAHKQAEC